MTTPKPIRILIAEDHKVTRMGIKMFCEDAADIEVVGEAADGNDALELARQTKPDVVLMDVQMPNLNGIDSSRQIRTELPSTKIVMMTSSRDERDVFAALAAGASGYCTKDVADERLLTAIRAVHTGDMWLDSTVAARVLQALPKPDATHESSAYQLSEREREVLRCVVDGLSNQEISKKLYISGDTVKSHVKHILEKLSVGDRTQAAVKALRENLL